MLTVHSASSPSINVRRACWTRDLAGRLTGDNFLLVGSKNPSYEETCDNFESKFQDYSFKAASYPYHIKKEIIRCDDSYDKKRLRLLNAKDEQIDWYSFPKPPGFSKWLNGSTTPLEKPRRIADQLFNGIDERWFGVNNFGSRLTRFLTVLDLAERAIKSHCLEDIRQIESILSTISWNWRPTKRNDQHNAFDFYIPGPEKRAGPIPLINTDLLDCSLPGVAELHNVHTLAQTKEHNKCMESKYDFTIGPSSYVYLSVPEGIVNHFNIEKPFSATEMMFIVLGTDLIEHESNYQNDLILDFLSAFICCGVLRRVKTRLRLRDSERSYTSPSPLNEVVAEFFFGTDPANHPSPREPSNGRVLDDDIWIMLYDYRDLYLRPSNHLSKGPTLIETAQEESSQLKKKYGCDLSFGQDFHLIVYDRLWRMRDRYLEILNRSGLSVEDLISEINPTIRRIFVEGW